MRRQPQEIKFKPGGQKSSATSLPAPIGGLNGRDSIANMPANDAVVLENWFPRSTSVEVRKGYTAWNTFTGVCQSIICYNGLTARKVFPAVKNGGTYSLYDGTSAGALSTAVVGGGGATVEALTSTRFDYANFGTSGGQFLTAVNGTDGALQYDGTTWSVSTISGATTSTFFTVGVYKRRLFFGVKNSLKIWYLPVDSITGAATAYELGPLFKYGGSLNSIITVTDQSNSGNSDYIGFLSTEGEVVAYTGADPSSSTDWFLAAHFRIGRPVVKGNSAWIKWGTDALIACADGIYPIRQAIAEEQATAGIAVTNKIRNFINQDVTLHGGRQGWKLMLHPNGQKLVLNVPTAEDVSSRQWVMNSETGAWCKYTGWDAMTFETSYDTLWMGMNGKMVKADSDTTDGGTSIICDGWQAYNYFGKRGQVKHMKLLRPVIAVDGAFNLGVSINVDYKDSGAPYLEPIATSTGDPWGGIWSVAWGGAAVAYGGYHGLRGVGKAISPRVKVQTSANLVWSASDLVYEYGGVLA